MFIWHIWIFIFRFSVNGVAYLHTEILKNTELHNFLSVCIRKNLITKQTVLHSAAGCSTVIHCFLKISESIGDEYKKDDWKA